MKTEVKDHNKDILNKLANKRLKGDIFADRMWRAGFVSGGLALLDALKWGYIDLESLELVEKPSGKKLNIYEKRP